MIFKDENTELFFKNNGYVIIDFYAENEIDNLSKSYKKISPESDKQYFCTLDGEYAFKVKINNILKEFYFPFIRDVFVNREFIFGALSVKKQGEKSEISSHQDWSVVDEKKSVGIGLLCPFIDVDINNGCVGVLPGSQNYFHNYRGSGTKTEYDGVAPYMEENLFKFLPMKKGQVLVLDNRTMHFSRPNTNLNERILACCCTRDKSADLVHYVGNTDGTIIQERSIENSFFIDEVFSKIEFKENESYPEFTLDNFRAITKRDLHELIIKYDPRLYMRWKYKLISKFKLS